MEKIDERADKSYLAARIMYAYNFDESSYKLAYKAGAEEQRKIDMEKVLKEVCRGCKYMLSIESTPCDRYPCKMYNNMRQAMEE